MRRMRNGGKCAVCGRSEPTGPFWENHLRILDFGTPALPPLEPDTTQPVRCDACEMLARLADPEYRRLCGPETEQLEREAVQNGGKKP
jgi:hypothetical protein